MNTQEKEFCNEDEIALRIANSLSVQDQSSLRMVNIFSDSPMATKPKNQSNCEAFRPNLHVITEDNFDDEEEVEAVSSIEFAGFSFGATISELDSQPKEPKTYERKGTGYLGMNTRSRYAS